MKQKNKELIADVLLRELESEFEYNSDSTQLEELKESYIEFINKNFKGLDKLFYITLLNKTVYK
jgi:hypothetical protein